MILVTGHKGYIGSKIYKKLVESGEEVIGIDLKDGKDILECLPDTDVDYVFHLAAFPQVPFSIENPYYTLKQNVLTSSKLLEWCKNHNVKRFIFSSSAAIYGNSGDPASPYGLHKLMTELECRLYWELYGLQTVCLRYFNVFSEDQSYDGAYSSVISSWMEKLRRGEPLRIDGDGEQVRDYVHIDDIVDVNIFCMKCTHSLGGHVFDVGTGANITINNVKEIVEKYHSPEWDYAPRRLGDVRVSRADVLKIKDYGWTSKVDPLTAIDKCFKGVIPK